MANVNVYVPDALKAQMDEFQGRNWSAIAQEAFRVTVTQERSRTMDTEAIASRLRTTAGTNSTAYKRGFEEGKEWAATEAELDDLEILIGFPLEDRLYENEKSAIRTAAELAEAMGADDARYFFGDDGSYDFRGDAQSPVTPARLRGFVAGALEVYKAVNGKL